jgi:cytochrome c2
MVLGLLAIGAAGAGGSLIVQKLQSKQSAREHAEALTGGHKDNGVVVFDRHGCGACHSITGHDAANGLVGPSLDKVAVRAFLAGQQPNDPPHMIAWVQHPHAVEPETGMPELDLTDQEARDVAAYLYTLR